MRSYLWGAIISVFLFCNSAIAQSPPFSTVTIFGTTKETYDKVSLFGKGSSRDPFKSEYVTAYHSEYSIDVDIPEDMVQHKDYFFTDMRFWGDRNNNDVIDPGEPLSECHFIIWVPAQKKVFLKVCDGEQYEITSPEFEFNYE